ncbi:MAG TPA: hypothetical protein VK473_03865 [Terriglobales bacterium]|nr:hypothetical protein [Terriglobales bacterium]
MNRSEQNTSRHVGTGRRNEAPAIRFADSHFGSNLSKRLDGVCSLTGNLEDAGALDHGPATVIGSFPDVALLALNHSPVGDLLIPLGTGSLRYVVADLSRAESIFSGPWVQF